MANKIERKNMRQTDSKGRTLREPKRDNQAEGKNYQWWLIEDNDTEQANSVVNTVQFIQHHQGSRLEQLTVSTRLYGNTAAYNLIGTAFTRANSVNSNPQSQRMSFNVCASVIDTLTSMIAKNKVIPTFITEGGVWDMQRKAEKLSKFTEGMFYQHKIHDKVNTAFRDCCVWGDGFVHIYECEDEVCVERVLSHELFVDNIEALATSPTQLHRVKYTDRDTAIAQFPDKREYLLTANPTAPQDIGGAGTAAQLITLTESWHLKSGKKAKDGLHLICCGDEILFKEEWKKDYFPFAQLSYSKRLLGWFGQGICERLQNIQGEINRNMMLVQRSFWMGGSFKVLLENGSKVVSQHLNNDVGAIIHYTGTPPQYITPPTIQPEIIAYIDQLIDKAYRQEGISQMTAAGTRPAEELSGRALREMNDNEQDRFMQLYQGVEQFGLEIARQMIETAKDIYVRKGTYKATYPDTKFLETIDWKDIKLDEDQYVLKAFPVSMLPDDPAARMQTVQEYAQAGWISPRGARRLMAMPDIEMSDNLANAPEELLCKMIEDMLDKGKYKALEPFHDLQLARTLGLNYYNYAQLNNCPDSKLKILRKWMANLDDMMGINQPPPQPMPGNAAPPPVGGQPQAVPQPPPQSALLPNSPGGQ
jgi:hypothetical protein